MSKEINRSDEVGLFLSLYGLKLQLDNDVRGELDCSVANIKEIMESEHDGDVDYHELDESLTKLKMELESAILEIDSIQDIFDKLKVFDD